MFQEIQSYSDMEKFINEKFPESIKAGNRFTCFTNPNEELNALRHGIGIRPCQNSVLIKLTGKDVLEFLHRVSTNSLLDLELMHTRNTLFLNEKGRFIDRTNLLSIENEFMLVGSEDPDKKLFSWVSKFIIMEDIITKDITEDYSILELIGPQTESFLTLIIGSEANNLANDSVRKFFIDGFMFYLYQSLEGNNITQYKIIIEKEKTTDFLNYLFENKSVFDLALVGDIAFTAFRIKNKMPAFPNEINDSTNPHEVNLVSEISFKKGCYIGQEVIARLDTYDKVKRNMVSVDVSGFSGNTATPITILTENTEAGILTSYVNSELLSCKLGLALVNKKILESQDELFLLIDENKIPVKLIQ